MIVSNNGKDAITAFKLLHYDKKTNNSLVKCDLQTGRTHQIRVTLSSLNYPIVNDIVYNTSNGKMLLCAYKIQFKNIFDDGIICVNSKYIQDFYDVCNYKEER